jgi:alkylhydroperoxidase/carboxymuconolactone decarboxylase family protein YurZ
MMLSASQAAFYRRLTIGDHSSIAALLAGTRAGEAERTPDLDARSAALVKVAALIVAGGTGPAYQREVHEALALGVSPAQLTGVLVAVAPISGSAHIMDAAPKLALALGYDVEAGLEGTDVTEEAG